MNDAQYKTICNWMYRNARPVDLARWQFHFENGSKQNILNALSAYQNVDGGFAHALEADSWNPNSSPIQTWCAIELLREIDISDRNEIIIQGILKYLDSGKGFTDNKWTSEIKSNNDYPHAFWWNWKQDSIYDYNPTANLAGFAIKFADKHSPLHQKACDIAKQAAASFFERSKIDDGHLLLCFMRLYQCCLESDTLFLFDMIEYSKKLSLFVGTHLKNIQLDWSSDGVALEYLKAYSNNLQAILIDDLQIKTIANYLFDSLQEDGTWNIPWNWNAFNDDWAVSKNWWRAYGIIVNMLFLKQHGYLATYVK